VCYWFCSEAWEVLGSERREFINLLGGRLRGGERVRPTLADFKKILLSLGAFSE